VHRVGGRAPCGGTCAVWGGVRRVGGRAPCGGTCAVWGDARLVWGDVRHPPNTGTASHGTQRLKHVPPHVFGDADPRPCRCPSRRLLRRPGIGSGPARRRGRRLRRMRTPGRAVNGAPARAPFVPFCPFLSPFVPRSRKKRAEEQSRRIGAAPSPGAISEWLGMARHDSE
jgi:hypothetical protein